MGKINYNLFSNYFIVFLIYIFHVFLNESRLGIVYIITFTIFISIRKIHLKSFLSLIIFLSISLSSYTIYSSIMGSFYNHFTETKLLEVMKGIFMILRTFFNSPDKIKRTN